MKNPETPAQGRSAWVLWVRALAVVGRMLSVVCVVVTILLMAERTMPTLVICMFGFATLFYVRDTWRIVAKAFDHGVDHADWWQP